VAKLVKMADMIDNSRGDKFVDVYTKEKRFLLEKIGDACLVLKKIAATEVRLLEERRAQG
jgi:hypothetical protein